MMYRIKERLPKEIIIYLRKYGPATTQSITVALNPEFNGNLSRSRVSGTLIMLCSAG